MTEDPSPKRDNINSNSNNNNSNSTPELQTDNYSGNNDVKTEAIREDTGEDIQDLDEDMLEDNNEDLTPPPDSPRTEDAIHGSSPAPGCYEDEIVVGMNGHSAPSRVPEPDDVTMSEAGNSPVMVQHPKRKRASGAYAESVGDGEASPAPTDDLHVRRIGRPPKAATTGAMKGVLLGYWRDSPAEKEADKHGVVGFIDIRDRLRTRIQPTTRDGRPMDPRYPIPPGPGGSWVTFDKVAFDSHLVGKNHHVVKEYVKIRAEDHLKDEASEKRVSLDAEAAQLAAERVRANPPPEAPIAPLIAYGPELPPNAVVPNRPESKKRRLASYGAPAETPKAAALDNLPGTRPTRIMVGYWKSSSEPDPVNKHAVVGILGANDMFRVKLTRETRDGRPLIGNFPQGAGALWIHWEEVEFEPHLRRLTRNEIKEYCRIRQFQLDRGEAPEDRVANETQAVFEGQQRVARHLSLTGLPSHLTDWDLKPIAMKGSANTPNGRAGATATAYSPVSASPLAHVHNNPHQQQQQQQRRATNGPREAAVAAGRHPLPDVEFRAANRATPAAAAAAAAANSRPSPNPAAIERTHSLANREIARLEATQARSDMRAAAAAAAGGGSRENSLGDVAAAAAAAAAGLTPDAHGSGSTLVSNGSVENGRFQENVSRLNKVWAAQENNRIRAGGDADAKMYGGVKYQRKQNGPFQGKLVSQGMIITIDGEDYVEYRVLTKPSFF
ncbi:hypothetical protein C8A05DRAFT_12147 [Staphylotrichum tortipilum]|uniref:Uncharacterized protein n=1 Tax=Staphylotrichum tortipilum TaxID=2831512 RepID=A0AAN6MS56_9PEZI|nr:hypothetical protein C8A05DRAFT_12147 [Staphylotrichum longicolle]